MPALNLPRARLLLAVFLTVLGTREHARAAQAPVVRTTPPAARPPTNPYSQHLAEWMSQHRDLTPQQQQQALASEPGFRQLPPDTQQRIMARLAQLSSMSPQRRTRVLERAEEIEHLAPAQRQQVRGAMSELGHLPPDRRRVVARAFRDLRGMPLGQRQAYLGSEYLHRELSPQERVTLGRLLAVEPLLPPAQKPVPQP